jgi:hypothetical protein
MTRAEFVQGTATFLVVIVAGVLSEIYLDQYLPSEIKEVSTDSAEASSPACVDNDGSWKNWSWSNVPILSPKCREDR